MPGPCWPPTRRIRKIFVNYKYHPVTKNSRNLHGRQGTNKNLYYTCVSSLYPNVRPLLAQIGNAKIVSINYHATKIKRHNVKKIIRLVVTLDSQTSKRGNMCCKELSNNNLGRREPTSEPRGTSFLPTSEIGSRLLDKKYVLSACIG